MGFGFSLKKDLKPTGLGFEIHAAAHCNLRCKECGHFSPYAEKGFADLEILEKDLARFSELSGGEADYILVTGGEPLLNPEIETIVGMVFKHVPKLGIMHFYTNGALLPSMPESFWKTVGKYGDRFYMKISLYPATAHMLKTWMRLVQERGIGCETLQRFYMFSLDLDPEGKQGPAESWERCHVHLPVLRNGVFYKCPRAAGLGGLNKRVNGGYALSPGDSLDLHKMESVQELAGFINGPAPFCRHCRFLKGMNGFTRLAGAGAYYEIEPWEALP
jgi:hypothetical protein